MDTTLLKIFEYAPAVGVLAVVVYFFLRQQEKREESLVRRDETLLTNFIAANERLDSANHRLAELMSNHLTELSRSLERHVQTNDADHRVLRDLLEKK